MAGWEMRPGGGGAVEVLSDLDLTLSEAPTLEVGMVVLLLAELVAAETLTAGLVSTFSIFSRTGAATGRTTGGTGWATDWTEATTGLGTAFASATGGSA